MLLAGERAGVVFADILTLVFEDVAATLDKYCPIVKSCYSNSYLQPFVTQLQVSGSLGEGRGEGGDWIDVKL